MTERGRKEAREGGGGKGRASIPDKAQEWKLMP